MFTVFQKVQKIIFHLGSLIYHHGIYRLWSKNQSGFSRFVPGGEFDMISGLGDLEIAIQFDPDRGANPLIQILPSVATGTVRLRKCRIRSNLSLTPSFGEEVFLEYPVLTSDDPPFSKRS